MRRADSVCFLCLWIAGGLIDLHYHVLLLNLEGHMHKNRWWPINLQPPRRSASVPARRISKFILLKNQFLFSLCGPQLWPGSAAVSSQQDYLTARKISQRRHKENQRSLLPLVTRRLDDRACSFTLTPRSHLFKHRQLQRDKTQMSQTQLWSLSTSTSLYDWPIVC